MAFLTGHLAALTTVSLFLDIHLTLTTLVWPCLSCSRKVMERMTEKWFRSRSVCGAETEAAQ